MLGPTQVFIHAYIRNISDSRLQGKRRVRRIRYKWEDNIKQHLPEIRGEGVNDTECLHFRVRTRTLWWRLTVSLVSYRAVFSPRINAWRSNDIIYHGVYIGRINKNNRSYRYLQSLRSSHDTSCMRNYIVTVSSPSGRQHFSLYYVTPSYPLNKSFSATASSITNLGFFVIFVFTFNSRLSVIITFNMMMMTTMMMMMIIIIIS